MLAARPAMHLLATVALALWLWAAPVRAADVPYVPTPWEVVNAMLKLAAVGPNDFLIDLGSGDGRIVITAVKRTGARGLGVDLDDNLVHTSRRNAEKEGVKDRAEFHVRNLFDTDISKATVISMYLFNSVLLRLRPSLIKLNPGTRLVSHDFDMGHWTPDEKLTIAVPDKSYGPPSSEIFLWIVPVDASGRWRWQMPVGGTNLEYDASFEQTFQMLAGTGQAAGARALVRDARVRGEQVMFTLMIEREGRVQRQEFSGRLMGDTMEGRMTMDGVQAPWRATRVARGKMNIEAVTPFAEAGR